MDGRSKGKRRSGDAKTIQTRVTALALITLVTLSCMTAEPASVVEVNSSSKGLVVSVSGAAPEPEDGTDVASNTGELAESGTAPPTQEVPHTETAIDTFAKTQSAAGISSAEDPDAAEMTTPTAAPLAPSLASVVPPPGFRSTKRRPPRGRVQSLSKDQILVLESAFELLDLPPECPVTVNGKNFKLDCIGTVSAIFYRLGVDVTKDFNRYTGNGVGRLFKSLLDKNALHVDKFPVTGDIVFWNNSWDANNDGNYNNDPTTHAAVVLQVEDDGTIHYVHEHIRKGVIVERMNLYQPTVYRTDFGKILNNAMALGSYFGNPANPPHWLSGDLWYQFGGILSVKDQYRI